MKTNHLTLASLLVALGTLTGNLIYIPVGVARAFPVQHLINILGAVLLGPFYAVLDAFLISFLRNLLGTGSLLAFPGSMIGALLAGLFYRYFNRTEAAIIGEIFGTGILGALFAYPIASLLMGSKTGLFFFVPSFLLSSGGGAIIAYFFFKVLEKSNTLEFNK